ncbi:MAG: hypothetical protein HY364_05230 [Candidatus Aenigmarchaeota archaeon]|nr:hypothetical protein [Candidatus Aenigmarchaeota archaeon]
MEKLVKDVKEEEWKVFRAEAAMHGLKVGEFFGYLVEEHIKMERKTGNWDNLSKRKVLTEKDAKKMKEALKIFEKGYDFE